MAEFPITWRLQVQGAQDVKARLQEINEQFARGELTTHQYAQKLREVNRDANTLNGAIRLQSNLFRAMHPNLTLVERSFSRMSSVARSVMSTLDTINIIQLVMIGRSNELVDAQDALEKAQRNYNLAVEQFGANSPQAIQALEALNEAQNKLNKAMKDADADRLNSIVGTLSGAANIAGSLGFAVMGLGRFSSALGGLGGVITSSVLPALGSMLAVLTALGPASLVIIGAIAAVGLLAYTYNSNLFNMKDVVNFVGSSIITFFAKALPDALSYTGRLITDFALSAITTFTSFGSFMVGLFTKSIPQAITQFLSMLPNFVSYITAQISSIINAVNNAVNALLGLMGIRIGGSSSPSVSSSSGSVKTYSTSSSSSSSSKASSSSSSSKSSAGGLSVKGSAIPLQHGINAIVNKPTLFLAGEAGAEYVYVQPLHRLSNNMNTSNTHPSIVININVGSLIGSDRAAVKQLVDIICNEISNRVGVFHF